MFTCLEDPEQVDMQVSQYKLFTREEQWTGKIAVQLSSLSDVKGLYAAVHGRTVCTGGLCRTLEVSSPAYPHLDVKLCMCTFIRNQLIS